MKNEHRWSGWPGAWCLDCGAECQGEICLADSCIHGFTGDPEVDINLPPCPIHVETECKEPGSNRCDPYAKMSVK